jgi:hypothetical protein
MAGPAALVQSLAVQSRVGTLVNTFTTAQSILNPEDVLKGVGNYMKTGSVFKLKCRGGLSNIATTPGNVFFQVMIGAVIVWTSGNLALNASARVLLPFTLEVDLRVDSVGAGTAAKILGMGTFGGVHLTNTDSTIQIPTTAPAVGTGFNSNVGGDLDLFVGFSVSNVGNGVQPYHYEFLQIAGLSQ